MTQYLGIYKGQVVNNSDPNGLERVQVRVKGLIDAIPDSALPWASYQSQTPSGKEGRGGSCFRPEKGSKVYVRFLEGDINYPVYFGGVVESKNDLPKNTAKGRYVIYESPVSGITITVNDNSGDIEIRTKKYNTTLNTIIDLFLEHAHVYSLQGAPVGTSIPDKISAVPGPVPLPYTSADFKTGTLK